MKYKIKIFLLFIFILFIDCSSPEKLSFLTEKLLSFNSNSSNPDFAIRCFWLETQSMALFDLKGLKRPFNQK